MNVGVRQGIKTADAIKSQSGPYIEVGPHDIADYHVIVQLPS